MTRRLVLVRPDGLLEIFGLQEGTLLEALQIEKYGGLWFPERVSDTYILYTRGPDMIDPEQRRAGLEKIVKLGIVLAAAAATYTYAWMAVLGLIGWGVATLIVAGAWAVAPAVATAFANWRIGLLIAAIEANPIETMLSLYADKKQELARQDAAITEFDAQFKSVSSMVDDLRRTDPAEAAEYVEMRDKMKEGLVSLREEQAAASEELGAFKRQIDKAQRIWKVANAMNAALVSSESAQAAVFAEIKEKVSFDTVRDNLNRAFANLDSAVARRKNAVAFATASRPKALPQVVDITPLSARTTLKVGEKT